LSSSTYQVGEGDGFVTITVTRTGNNSGGATINYATSQDIGLAACNVLSGTASESCDFGRTMGTLRFAAGEESKTFIIPIVDDVLSEGTETFSVQLSRARGASLGSPATALVTISDNDINGVVNSIDASTFFIKHQYVSFLGRLPDSLGLAKWLATLNDLSTNDTKRGSKFTGWQGG
jgi:hypothetical protein